MKSPLCLAREPPEPAAPLHCPNDRPRVDIPIAACESPPMPRPSPSRAFPGLFAACLLVAALAPRAEASCFRPPLHRTVMPADGATSFPTDGRIRVLMEGWPRSSGNGWRRSTASGPRTVLWYG